MTKDTCTEYLRYDFTRDEQLDMGQSLARKSNDLQEAEARKKAVVAQLKQESESATSSIATLSRQLANGYEYRNVECRILWHAPRVGMATIVRTDTGEIVKERQMTDSERQDMLPFEEKEGDTPAETNPVMPDAQLEAYFREHLNDDTVIWPLNDGATEDQCQRIWDKLQQEGASA